MGKKEREDEPTKDFEKAAKGMGKPSKKEKRRSTRSSNTCRRKRKSSRGQRLEGNPAGGHTYEVEAILSPTDLLSMTPRRFPSPRRADKIAGGYVVRDANGQALD